MDQQQYEQLEKRWDELRKNRAQRAALLKRRRRRKRRQALVCLCLLGLTVYLVTYFVRFPARYRAAQTASLSQQKKTAAVTNSPAPQALAGQAQPSQKPQETDQNQKGSEFSQLDNYEPDHSERYQAYRQLHPELGAEEVVWRVNCRLDLTQFTDALTVTADQLNKDLLVIVNKYYRVPEDYQPSDLVENADGCTMRYAAQQAFDQMKADAQAQGYTLRAVSGYRSVSYQEGLYQSYLASDSRENVDRYSARAGYSEHHTGLAVDVFGSVDGLNEFVTTKEYQWVLQNGHQYGFIIRYTGAWEDVTGYEDEPWHLRYIGTAAATEMKEKNIATLEEYRDRYVLH